MLQAIKIKVGALKKRNVSGFGAQNIDENMCSLNFDQNFPHISQ